jgi:Cof subfamily protein (haloacid dehalogenase superfamily)
VSDLIRLVATDLDGTIVGPDGSVSDRTVEALRAVAAAGAHVVIVTGRPTRWMADVASRLGGRGTALCANGAVVYDLGSQRVLQVTELERPAAAAVVAHARQALGAPTFALELTSGLVRDPGYLPRWDSDQRRVHPIDDLVGEAVSGPGGADAADRVIKLLVRDETSDADSMLAAMAPLLDGLAVPTHSNVHDCLVEVSALGVDKGAALARLAMGWGIRAREVVAFGDMPNDVPMLEWAGEGYAVEGGHPAALAGAPRRAGAVTEDGVAQVLEALLSQGRLGA